MTIEERIRGRKIGVIGMARSGIAAALLADRFGGDVFVSDSAGADKVGAQLEKLNASGIEFETGGHSDRLLSCDYIVISPGIPLTVGIVTRLRQKAVPIFSELEFASWVCRGPIVAITGSNGKTTTTSLTGEIFNAAGYDTFVCGNIGYPFAAIADKVPENGVAVVEVSTFQLETIADFKPHVAMILNLTPDHLDRHGSFEEYKRLKFRITDNQTADDYLIINGDDPETAAFDVHTRATLQRFSVGRRDHAITFVEDGSLFVSNGKGEHKIVAVNDIAIKGNHNLQNAAAATAAAIAFDIDADTIAGVLKTFPGVEHRLEPAGRVAGIFFINDSKATNVDSVVVAVRAVKGPIHLIMGGLDKGAPYIPLIAAGEGKIKGIVAIGEAKEKIFSELGRAFSMQFADSLEEAVKKSFEAAVPGETVLLSPGCASFDMFDNFEHRGRAFKAAVAGLKNGKKNNETITNR